MFCDVILKGDALQIVRKANSDPPHLSRIGHFIESIQQELQGFSTSSIVFVSRECNSAAHVLANEAVANNVDSVWLEDVLRSISDIVIKE